MALSNDHIAESQIAGRSLDECAISWIALARELQVKGIKCTAPFLSAKPGGFDNSRKRVLLVGQATDGWYWDPGCDLNSGHSDQELARSQAQLNLNFRAHRDAYRAGFWPFLLRVAALFGDSSQDPQNLVWTNLFKLGGNPKGNPGQRLKRLQSSLVIETLRAEIREYKPSHVILATAYYHEELVKTAIGHHPNWTVESEGKPEESWTLETSTLPPMLWVRHPARKKKAAIEAWLQRAKGLLGPS